MILRWLLNKIFAVNVEYNQFPVVITSMNRKTTQLTKCLKIVGPFPLLQMILFLLVRWLYTIEWLVSVSRRYPGILQEVSRQSLGDLQVVSSRSPGCLQAVSRRSPGGLQVVSMQSTNSFQGCLQSDLQAVSRLSPGGLYAVYRQFSGLSPERSPGCLQAVSRWSPDNLEVVSGSLQTAKSDSDLASIKLFHFLHLPWNLSVLLLFYF